MSSGKAATRRAKGKTADQPHLTKKMKKVLRENKEIAKEFRETEAEVDKEERAITVTLSFSLFPNTYCFPLFQQTETLKLLFTVYFRILKNPGATPLLPAALHGISRFAHLVNIDFFKDLMKVLKDLISQEVHEANNLTDGLSNGSKAIHHRLLCIATAFELLSGQGVLFPSIGYNYSSVGRRGSPEY